MARAIEQLKQAMEACELGALTLPDQIDSVMDAGKAILQEVPTLTPPNEPLTLEQLREMDGEPVYIIAGDMGISEWNVIKGKGYITLAYDQPTIGFKAVKEGIEFINGRTFSIDSYGVTWIAYRRPPEGEANA